MGRRWNCAICFQAEDAFGFFIKRDPVKLSRIKLLTEEIGNEIRAKEDLIILASSTITLSVSFGSLSLKIAFLKINLM